MTPVPGGVVWQLGRLSNTQTTVMQTGVFQMILCDEAAHNKMVISVKCGQEIHFYAYF